MLAHMRRQRAGLAIQREQPLAHLLQSEAGAMVCLRVKADARVTDSQLAQYSHGQPTAVTA
ncbi:hypothetical protein LJR034_005089 [Caballeronia sp. LjRoot34]|uniref:hypothetical protein n=1 Tax=Caballeronia sp. LjRoot34 TaxID=3342325 RepID=UPI003ECDB266